MSTNRDFLNFFNISETPFTREFQIKNRVKFQHIENEALKLRNVIMRRQSGVIIGAAGMGKTVLLRSLRDNLPGAHIEFIYIKMAGLGLRDMTRQIADALRIDVKSGTSHLIKVMEAHFTEHYKDKNIQYVLALDEAHEIKPNAFQLLKGITNFNMDSKLIVSLILCGQLPLKDILCSSKFVDIKQRMNYYAMLRPLTKEETFDYIKSRIQFIGDLNIFTERAMDEIHEISKGTMRAIDAISLLSMEKSFEKKVKVVDSEEVKEAMEALCLN